MYQLKINRELEPGKPAKWETVDLGEDVIALSYQANNIAEMSNRQANRSNTITLPLTANNRMIFGIAEMPQSLTMAPYRYMDARLYEDGVTLFGPGAKLRLQEANDDGFKVAIYGSTFDIFKLMANKSIRYMDLGTCEWSTQAVANSNIDNLVSFPVVDYDVNDPSLIVKVDGDNTAVDSKNIMPCISFRHLCERCVSDHGYTLQVPAKVAADTRYTQAVVPFSTLNISLFDKFSAAYGGTSGDYKQDLVVGKTQSYYFNSLYGRMAGSDGYKPAFTCIAKGMYKFEWVVQTGFTNVPTMIWVTKPDGTRTAMSVLLANRQNRGVFTISLNLGDTLSFDVSLFISGQYGGTEIQSASVNCMAAEIERTGFPSYYLAVADNLPDLKQSEIIGALCKMWCLVPVVDIPNKVLKFFTYEELYANKSKAKDWTGKLDNRYSDMEFSFMEYAQNNTIRYKDEDGKAEGKNYKKITSEGSFTIDDQTLEPSKTLFELIWNATEETTIAEVKMAKIRVAEQGAMEAPNLPAKILFTRTTAPGNGVWVFKDPNQDNQFRATAHVASFAEMGMDVLIHEYDTLVKGLLNRTRVMTLWFNLSPVDLIDFDHSIPVYIDKYNIFCYVNAVKNYIPKRLTAVELVVMRPIQN